MKAMNNDVATKITLVVLTYNAAKTIEYLMDAVLQQSLQPTAILVIDSSSTDGTLEKIKKYPVQIHIIKQNEFDHGTTRKLATTLIDSDFYIYLTQDSIPANSHAFQNLLKIFVNEKVGCAYGRQLPNADADPIAAHLRLFNYPATSYIRSLNDREKYGYKVCFNSDSFAAYRRIALIAIGNFPEKTIVCEDTYVAAKMLLNNWDIAYVAEACVRHSHNYTLWQHAMFCFDIGVFHADNSWLLQEFKGINFEGIKYIYTGILNLWKNKEFIFCGKFILGQFINYCYYALGRFYAVIPKNFRKKLSLCGFYWK